MKITQQNVIVNITKEEVQKAVAEYVTRLNPQLKDMVVTDVDLGNLNTQGDQMGVNIEFVPSPIKKTKR